jgi:hypothetical protein
VVREPVAAGRLIEGAHVPLDGPRDQLGGEDHRRGEEQDAPG